MQTFVYDNEAAQKVFGFIDESGIYDMTIVEAYIHTSQKGSQAFRLELVTDSGQPLTHDIWIKKADGTDLTRGVDEVSGKLLAAVKAKGIKPEQKKIEVDVWDDASQKRVKQSKMVEAYPSLIGKQLKAAVQMQENEYNGKTSIRPSIIGWFTSDGLSPREFANKVSTDDAKDLQAMADKLASQPVKSLSESAKTKAKDAGEIDFMAQPTANARNGAEALSGVDFDDDIPF